MGIGRSNLPLNWTRTRILFPICLWSKKFRISGVNCVINCSVVDRRRQHDSWCWRWYIFLWLVMSRAGRVYFPSSETSDRSEGSDVRTGQTRAWGDSRQFLSGKQGHP